MHFNAVSQHRLLSVRRGDPTLATRDSAASSVVNQSHTLGPQMFRRLGVLSRGSYVKGAIETHGPKPSSSFLRASKEDANFSDLVTAGAPAPL